MIPLSFPHLMQSTVAPRDTQPPAPQTRDNLELEMKPLATSTLLTTSSTSVRTAIAIKCMIQ